MVFKSLYNKKFFEKFYDEMESVWALIDALEIDNEKERKNIFDFSKNKKRLNKKNTFYFNGLF